MATITVVVDRQASSVDIKDTKLVLVKKRKHNFGNSPKNSNQLQRENGNDKADMVTLWQVIKVNITSGGTDEHPCAL